MKAAYQMSSGAGQCLAEYTVCMLRRNASVKPFHSDVIQGDLNSVVHTPVYGHRAGM